MFTHSKILSYFTGCLLSTFILLPGMAQAQITAYPMILELKTQRGQGRGTINIKNEGDTAFRARVYATPFTYNRNGFEALESSPNDLTPYLTFSPRELVVEPGQTRSIRAVSRLLPSMAKQEYRAVIFTENLQETQIEQGNSIIGIIPIIGMTVYVRHGEISPNLTVKTVQLDPENKRIKLLVQNSGKATTFPKTSWTLTHKETTLNQGEIFSTTVIAEGERYINIPNPFSDKIISAGNYQLSGELTWGDKNEKLPFQLDFAISAEQAAAANQPQAERNNQPQ